MTLTEPQQKLAGRLAALGLLLALLLGATRVLILPVVDAVSTHRADMAILRERLSAIDAEAARIPALKQQIADLSSTPVGQEGLWTGSNDNAISVAIQSRVRQLLQSAGTNVSRLDASIVQDASGFRRHMLRVGFTGGDKELIDVVVALARQRPYLKIETLSVRAREVSRPAKPGDATFATVLTVELELAGLGQDDDAKGARP
jgi:hypothetical protein